MNLTVREMRAAEKKEIIKMGRAAFPALEALFVAAPKKAMVAECDGKLAGCIIYKYLNANHRKIAYIEDAFVDPAYHGKGVGRKLYTETFEYLRAQGCDDMTGLVKDDNVASWKLFTDNGFKRVSLADGVKQIGAAGMLKQCLFTPLLFAVGMDFYMYSEGSRLEEKSNSVVQIVTFFLLNMLLVFPLWFGFYQRQSEKLLYCVPAYLSILIIFTGIRVIGGWMSKEKWMYRFNNGGALITLFLSIWGNTFPMNANWYPQTYENTKAFRRKMAIPEIIKLCVCMLLPLLAFTENDYLRQMAQISCYFLILMIFPVYPFEALGGGRIYRYSKAIWAVTAAAAIIELMVIYNIAG